MVAFLTALGLFVASFCVHAVLWRLRVPNNQTHALVVIFGLTPLVLTALLLLGPFSSHWQAIPLSDWAGIALFEIAATGCYLIVYTGIEEDSPSISLIWAMEGAGKLGCSREDLTQVITEERFIKPRVRALQRGGFLEETTGGQRLTARGRRAARTAMRLSRLFNIHDSV
jgi:hypothetical protein